MVLAYLIIKAWMVLLRWACCWLLMLPSIIGVIINLGFTLFWILGMMAYYIAALVYFFSKDNDCLDNGTLIWVAMLLIVIEAFSMIIIICILLCVLACMIPAVIQIKKPSPLHHSHIQIFVWCKFIFQPIISSPNTKLEFDIQKTFRDWTGNTEIYFRNGVISLFLNRAAVGRKLSVVGFWVIDCWAWEEMFWLLEWIWVCRF